jgi:endonuclease G
MARRDQSDPNLQPLISAFFQLNFPAQVAVVVVLLIAGFIAYHFYHHTRTGPGGASDGHDSPSMVLGNPSSASPDPSNRNNFLMVKPYYALSYNESTGTPNWVSWCVTESDLGEAPRKDEFDEDRDLPANFFHVTQQDYSRSGFDRGHMCPHSDRAANVEMSYSTFIMTNIIPQAPNVNRKAWAQMEDYCRELVRHHDRLFITAGPIGEGGIGSEGRRNALANGRVTVPSACWKVVIDTPDDGRIDLAHIGTDARVLAVEMPNNNEIVNDEWAQYRVTPAQIEQQTGLHFFDKLRPEVASMLRNKLDRMPLPRPRPLMH